MCNDVSSVRQTLSGTFRIPLAKPNHPLRSSHTNHTRTASGASAHARQSQPPVWSSVSYTER